MLPLTQTRHVDRLTSRTWRAAFACFLLAAATGALYRFSIGYGFDTGLSLPNIRHAHSHLMYFGWGTPALMALLIAHLDRSGVTFGVRPLRWLFGAAFAAALLAYPLFLLYGYQVVEVGDARLPLAMIAASLNVFVWYAFVALYVLVRRAAPQTRALRLWDFAVFFLVVATLGAWGLALLQPLGLDSVFASTLLVHVFLDLFSEGWFVLAVLGLAYATIDVPDRSARHWSDYLLIVGLPFLFPLGVPESLLTPALRAVAAAGGALVGVGLLINVVRLWPRAGWLWRLPLLLLGLKAAGQVIVCLWPGAWWSSLMGLRVLYLHLMLLGFVTLGLVAAAKTLWPALPSWSLAVLYGAAAVVLLALVPLTTLWPPFWQGTWALQAAAWTSLLPVLAGLALLARCTRPAPW